VTANDSGARQPDRNRTVFIVIVGLIIVLVAGYAIAKSTSSSSSPSAVEPGTRAVVVPTADAARTVVVAPCGTGANVLSSNATAVMDTTGAISLQLPQGYGNRVVLIPKCSGGQGGAAGATELPSAAFVTHPGTRLPSIGSPSHSTSPQAGAPTSAQFVLTVPSGSAIRTIVLGPCQKARPSGPSQQVLSAAGGSSTAVAPAC
jgi:hypothetical protein